MQLILTEIKRLKADEDMRCDAFAMWYAMKDSPSLPDRCAEDLFKSRLGKIFKGERYLFIQFVDEDGEALELNCRIEMNRIMFREKLYKQLVIEAMEKYKANFKTENNTD